MATCTFVSQSCYSSSAWQSDNPYCYVGAQGSNNYCTTIIKFTTPSFSGSSTNIKFNLAVAATSKKTVSLRYAIATSDANKNSYTKTYSAVSDSNQVASGTTSLEATTSLSYDTISIDTTALQGSKTYYLFLWSAKSGDSNSYIVIQPQGMSIDSTTKVNHTITITSKSTSADDEPDSSKVYYVYINNGSGWDKYIPYINNGSGWDQYVLYINNGSKWEIYG